MKVIFRFRDGSSREGGGNTHGSHELADLVGHAMRGGRGPIRMAGGEFASADVVRIEIDLEP